MKSNVMRTDWAILAIRLAIGVVFVGEGFQKLLFAETLGAGRFAKIGIPFPGVMGPVVGVFEIVCGLLVLIGLHTRPAAVPLLGIMIVAVVTTKFPILLGRGIWLMLHEWRTDFAMICCLVHSMFMGSGALSVEGWLAQRGKRRVGL